MVNLALGCVRHYMCLLRFSEEGEDDLDLFWGEDFAGAGVAGGLEGGEEGFVGMDFVGEAFACGFLENNLRADGSVAIPEALRPYMGGKTAIR